MSLANFWRRHCVVIIFPTLSIGSIAADYSYTQRLESSTMMFGLTRQYLLAIVPLAGYGFGWFLDNKETERMTMFRDKSALYGRVLKEGEKPSWP
ncbi:hypothetical protein pipiens_000856, partial [Culex pipiens pipiens]